MAFLIGGANTLRDTGYEITNSLRFDGSSSFLRDTLGTPTSQKKFTFSCWAKGLFQRGGSVGSRLCSAGANGDGHYTGILHFVRTNGTPQIYISDSAGYYVNFNNQFFRDPAAWYHFVVAIDTTQSTATNRTKLYINGTQLSNTLASHEEQPSEDYDWPTLASGQLITIGANTQSDASFYDGYMADVHFIDGQAKAPTDFGEFDDSGIWKPIEYTGTFGNNGFKLEFKQVGTSTNSSGIGADTSGNDIHLAVTGLAAIDVTTDTPTNNFCTLNPLSIQYDSNGGSPSGMVHSEGNTQAMNNTSSGWGSTLGTFLIPTSGKWYWELKNIPGDDHIQFGVMEHGYRATTGAPLDSSGLGWGWYSDDGNTRQNGYGGRVSGYSTWKDENDIIMIAYDANNGKMWLGLDGTWEDDSGGGGTTGDPAAGSNQTFTVDNVPVVPCLGTANISSGTGPSVNFGNPPYANSSSQADDNGYGDFEYDVPAGFYALCSKNLAKYGG